MNKDSKNIYGNPELQHPKFTLEMSYFDHIYNRFRTLQLRDPIYIFWICRHHTILVCIWFPRYISWLTLPEVQPDRVAMPSVKVTVFLRSGGACQLSLSSEESWSGGRGRKWWHVFDLTGADGFIAHLPIADFDYIIMNRLHAGHLRWQWSRGCLCSEGEGVGT